MTNHGVHAFDAWPLVRHGLAAGLFWPRRQPARSVCVDERRGVLPVCAAWVAVGFVMLAVAPAVFAQEPDAAVPQHAEGRTNYRAPLAPTAPTVDGVADEPVWHKAAWQDLTHVWLGEPPAAEDFQGRYKVAWHGNRLYLLGEFVDDVLYDGHRDPLVRYWDDDSLEVFIDEDFSGGDHQFNHNAFAYHVALDNQSIDVGTDRQPRNYTHHVDSRWRQHGNTITWELAIDLYPDSYADGASDNRPVALQAGKVLGMMVAYCDNDGSDMREHFVGSEFVPGEDKNRGWIDAGLFGRLMLVD